MSSPPETRVVFESKTVSLASVHGVSTWAEYVESERTLVFHGVMTESERDKLLGVSADSAFQVAIHRLFEDSRRFFQSWEVTLTTEPPDLKLGDPTIAAELFGRLQYSATRKKLFYFAVSGPMTSADLEKFRSYSADANYQAALTRLHQTSRTFFNIGEKFISLFKWILILTTAEVLKAIAGTVYDNLSTPAATPMPAFPSKDFLWAALHSVAVPESISEMVKSDLVSFAKVITTVLLLIRYFVCLVDPVWKSVGIYPGRAFADGGWREKLSRVRLETLCGVAALSLIEFLILFHAAKAVTSVMLWLECLWLLVIVDSLAFFLLPPVFAACIWGFHKWIRLPMFYMKDFYSALRHHIKSWRHTRGLAQEAPPAEDLDRVLWKLESLKRDIDEARDRAKRPTRDYGYFNLFDWLSISIGMLLLKIPAAGEVTAVVSLTVMTLAVSLWNFHTNRALYQTHFAVLTLSRA
jgi:hypothetical protein